MGIATKRDNFDVIMYRKSGKYPYVSEQDDSCDILRELTGLKASAGEAVIRVDDQLSSVLSSPLSESAHPFSPLDQSSSQLSSSNNLSKSVVFVDGRYKLAAKLSINAAKFDIEDYGFHSVIKWIKAKIRLGSTIAYDPRFYNIKLLKQIKSHLEEYRFKEIDLEDFLNLRPKKRSLRIHRVKRTFAESKMANIYSLLSRRKLDAYLLCDPSSISWLLNIRDFASEFSPVVFGYLLIKKNFDITLYVDELYDRVENPSECPVTIKSEKDLLADLEKLSVIGVDESETPSHIHLKNFVHEDNPCIFAKATKNEVEIADIKTAARLDSAAIVNLLHWLYTEVARGEKSDEEEHLNVKKHSAIEKAHEKSRATVTEIQIANKLIEFRKNYSDYVGESFACISAADDHSAIIHYSPTEESDFPVKNVLLLDTGGQYKYGTTDITRTIFLRGEPTEEQKLFYTLVLKGHIAIASAKFPEGYSFSRLEAFARQFLWRYASDYPHSTSHGIGYMSCVHEKLSCDWQNNNLYGGMVISNEPGYYQDGDFGVRLENMMLVKDHLDGFLSFETISLVPFDWNFIDENLLTKDELAWIEDYHGQIYEKLDLSPDVKSWLANYMRITPTKYR